MNFTPRPGQVVALDFLADRPRACLFAQPGFGKTSINIETVLRDDLRSSAFPALVIGPKRVARKTWRDECRKWDDFHGVRVAQMIGTPEERLAAYQSKADLYTINPDNLPWLLDQQNGKVPWRSIIYDESTKLKNFRGSFQRHPKTQKLFLRVDSGKYAGALARMAFHSNIKRFVNNSGTPSPNGVINLWGQLFFVDHGERLGRTFTDFKDRWFRPAPNGYGIEPLPFAQEEIQDRIKDVALSLNARDWFDLREPVMQTIEVELPQAVRVKYKEMEKKFYTEIRDKGIEAFNAGSKSNKLLQLCSGAIYDDESNWHHVHDVKIEALRDLVDECMGAPIIVAYQYKHEIARLLEAFPEGRQLKTEQDEDDFRAGKIPVLFMHPASAGHGLDGLQYACNIIAFFGYTWDLELRQQIIERIGPTRQMQAGLDRPVFVYDIVCSRTIEEQVLERHAGKENIQSILMRALSARLGD